jgi:thiosulfate/3-mercaptopyruvate sulfurtransferase
MKRLAALAVLLFALPVAYARAAADFAYVRAVPPQAGLVVIDARPSAECAAQSLAGARCLPAQDFLGPHNRLPSARDLLWLLGTAGLTGAEDVLVVGGDARSRDFVAGLLYVAGQKSVRVLAGPVGRLLEQGDAAGPGRERGMIREAVFAAPMRDELLLLRDELRDALRTATLPLLDGRTESEYWGETARAARAGHLPGAVSLPALQLRGSQNPVLPEGSPVAYAHDALEGFAYLTLLRAGHGVAAKLYAEGWAEWAADGALPADAVSYPGSAVPVAEKSQPPQDGAAHSPALLAVTLVLVVTAFAAGWYLRSRRTSHSPAGRGAGGEGAA